MGKMDRWLDMTGDEYWDCITALRKTAAAQNGTRSTTTTNDKPTYRPDAPWLEVYAPPAYRKATLDNFRSRPGAEKALKSCRQWVDKFGATTVKGLLLHGPTGIGKTHLAYGIGHALADKGYWPYFANFVTLCSEIKKTWKNDYLFEGDVKRPVIQNSIVILDDVGAELVGRAEQGWVAELIYEIVRARAENQRPTVVTSNLNLDQLGQRYTQRVASRLGELCRPLWFKAADYRISTGDNADGRPGVQ